MLAYLVGNVSSEAAFVLVALTVGITIVSSVALGRKRKPDYDLEKLKIEEDFALKKYQTDNKLITSHRTQD